MKRMRIFLRAVANLLMGCSNNGSQTEGNNAASSSEKVSEAGKNSQSVPAGGYVDLGLSVYWKDCNEASSEDDHGFYTYDEAVKKFGSSLPTREQFEELVDKCTWTWSDSKKGYDVKGPNGNSIFLPAAGYRYCGGNVDFVGSRGFYWSSTPNDSGNAWYLYFRSSNHNMYYYYRCYGRSVRLVQD